MRGQNYSLSPALPVSVQNHWSIIDELFVIKFDLFDTSYIEHLLGPPLAPLAPIGYIDVVYGTRTSYPHTTRTLTRTHTHYDSRHRHVTCSVHIARVPL